jgi:crotonobetainyl-CoA:carnitine CoA-transferase CaiB-like acyl-CoA transferase
MTNHLSVLPSALTGVRVLDLSRVLAGPTCTQILGDLGADIIKIERPGRGDDTRQWGPPFLETDTAVRGESAYYLSANRNKRSVTVNIAHPEGQALILRLLEQCDVLIENFKVGNLARFGLAYEQIKERFPRLVYCSITGFGQTGPDAHRTGYDFLAQGEGGVMSITGPADGEPHKVGVAIADITAGLYATIGILAALRHVAEHGRGQHIDLALLDTQVSWLANIAQSYLVSGVVPQRLGNAHPQIVPYQVMPTADGYLILAVGNDGQFSACCRVLGVPELATDERFATNAARVNHRQVLIAKLQARLVDEDTAVWLEKLSQAGVPCGPVNDIGQVFALPQVVAREMKVRMTHPQGEVDLIGSPLKLSETPVSFAQAPPLLGEHTAVVLRELLGLSEEEINHLREVDAV